MRKFSIHNYQFTKKSVYPEQSRGAALIIALMIVTVASIMILGISRTVVTSTFTSVRYGDSVFAKQAAWSGIEDGLKKLKDGNWAAYLPDFASSSNPIYVLRRNLSTNNNDRNYPIDFHNDILNFQTIDGVNRCLPGGSNCAGWKVSDQYYDLRVSGSDDYISLSDSLKRVNVSDSNSVLKNNVYYQLGPNPSPNFKVVDLDNYYENSISSSTFPAGDTRVDFGQRIGFAYDIGSALSSGSITVEMYVKYKKNTQMYNWVWDPMNTPETPANSHLQCLYATNPFIPIGPPNFVDSSTRYATGNFFYNKLLINTSSPSNGTVAFYIPQACDGVSLSTILDYAAIKFTFTGVPSTTKLYFGLRTASGTYTDPVDPTLHYNFTPGGSSYLGTGQITIISTGIVNNIKKTLQINAEKLLMIDTAALANPDDESQLKCQSGSTPTNLQTCKIKVYRDTKY